MMEIQKHTAAWSCYASSEERGLTQRQLGELAGVAHTNVQRLESLKRGAYPQTLRKLATGLGIAPEELLYGESTQR
jgi:transcriptional regulator with XRE-family HTH domain